MIYFLFYKNSCNYVKRINRVTYETIYNIAGTQVLMVTATERQVAFLGAKLDTEYRSHYGG